MYGRGSFLVVQRVNNLPAIHETWIWSLGQEDSLEKGMVFPVVMYMGHKEGWVPKNRWFWIVMQEKTLESPLGQGDQTSQSYRINQYWIFIGRTYAEAEAPILWPPDATSWLIGKDPNTGKDWGQEEKGTTEDEMVGQHHQLNGHEFEQTLEDSEGWESLVCCSPWSCKKSGRTYQLKNNNV